MRSEATYIFFTKKCPHCDGMDVRMHVNYETGVARIGCATCNESETRIIPPEHRQAVHDRLEKRKSA